MGLLTGCEAEFSNSVANITYSNPFLPERIAFEQEALGDEFDEDDTVWSLKSDSQAEERPNVRRVLQRAQALADAVRQRLAEGKRGSDDEYRRYEGLLTYLFYRRYVRDFEETIRAQLTHDGKSKPLRYYRRFRDEAAHYTCGGAINLTLLQDLPHAFACLFHVRRTWHHIYNYIFGRSLPAAKLRAAVWQSAFTRDMRRYHEYLFDRMADFTTLIAGPSGTGKDLVARAIGMSRYIPFDAGTETFVANFSLQFHALNLSAMAPALIESELFGHRRGSFTGAVEDREGWLERCGALGSVFLDEIGELDMGIQVKLLRLLQNRSFQRIGERTHRAFAGKIIAATNRDIPVEVRAGRFRTDLYYRLCSDMIVTPSLNEQLRDTPGELTHFIRHILRRIVGDEGAENLCAEVEAWILANLGADYDWPGNIRELEQCVRNVLIRRDYRPLARPSLDPREQLARDAAAGRLTADELLNRYVTLVVGQSESIEDAARKLQLDRRTVKKRADAESTRKYEIEKG